MNTEKVPVFSPPLSEEDVAAATGVSRNTLRHWRWIGEGPRYVKMGKRIGYRPADLQAWIDCNVCDPGANRP
jgi:predicted DNA-binding transcriptional regulator AlpA